MLKNFTNDKRITFFLLGCIPIRLLFVAILRYIDKKYLPYLSIPLFIQGISFIYLYFANLRLSAPEAGGKTWWANLRLIHGMLFITSAIYAYQQKDVSWVPLLIDVIFGFFAFIIHHKYI